MRTMVVRRMGDIDLDAVVSLETAEQPTPWTREIFVEELSRDDRVYKVAVGPHVIGYCGAMVIGDEAHVTNLLVATEMRRRGVARALMGTLTEAVANMGARHLTLEVRSQNEAARSLYASLGMAPVGVRHRYYGDDDALIMWAHDIDTAPSVRSDP